jgi:hypothetical protein
MVIMIYQVSNKNSQILDAPGKYFETFDSSYIFIDKHSLAKKLPNTKCVWPNICCSLQKLIPLNLYDDDSAQLFWRLAQSF